MTDSIAALLAPVHSGPVDEVDLEHGLAGYPPEVNVKRTTERFVAWWRERGNGKLHTLKPYWSFLDREDPLPPSKGSVHRPALAESDIATRVERYRTSPYGLPAAIQDMRSDGFSQEWIDVAVSEVVEEYEARLRRAR